MHDDHAWLRRARTRGAIALCLCALVLAVPRAMAETAVPAGDDNTASSRLRVIKFNHYRPDDQHGSAALELSMLRDFAADAGLEIEWVNVFRSTEAFDLLLDGSADLSISPLPLEVRDDPRLAASEPLAVKRFRVIGAQGRTIDNPLDLRGMSLAVKLSSPTWSYLDRLRDALGDLRLQVLPDDLSRDAALRMVSDGIYDAALVGTDMGEKLTRDYPRLKYQFDLTGPQPVSWYARADRAELIKRLNRFIKRSHTAYHNPDVRMRTFAEVKSKGILRVITRHDGQNYFLKNGRPAGFELGLARRFAARHDLKLEVLVGRDERQVIDWLRRGAGDIVTSRLDSRRLHGEPAFMMSREYRYEPAVLVTNWTQTLKTAKSLRGRLLAAYADSDHVVALERFVGDRADVVRVAPAVGLDELLRRVEKGVVDAALIDARFLDAALAAHPDLQPGMSIPNPYRYRWTLRGNDGELADAVDDFLRAEYRNETYNILERRYVLGDDRPIVPAFDDISPFDDLLRDYSDRYGFDWRLIAAQMYKESRFNPRAVSPAGAMGLMQLMPSTARALGFDNPGDPEIGIHAGVKYMKRLRDRFDRHIPVHERTWLALAAYNIGFDRVRRARDEARARGLNPDKWFGNVELAMRQMDVGDSNGGCRCGQTIDYVRSIRSLYYAYRNVKLATRSGGHGASTAG